MSEKQVATLCTVWFLVVVNAITGALYGWSMSIVPVTIYYDQQSSNCSSASTPHACQDLRGMPLPSERFKTGAAQGCIWSATAGCVWVDDVLTENNNSNSNNNITTIVSQCSVASSQLACRAIGDRCDWDYHNKRCDHIIGWSSLQQGLFASSVMIGAFIGSASAPAALRRTGSLRRLLGLAGVVGVVGSVLTMLSRSSDSFLLLFFARIIVGMSVGAGTCAGPLYVSRRVPPELSSQLGLMFQIFLCLSLCASAVIGLALQAPDPATEMFVDPPHIERRIQIVFACNLVVCCGVVVLAYFLEPKTVEQEDEEQHQQQQQEEDGRNDENEPPTETTGLLVQQQQQQQRNNNDDGGGDEATSRQAAATPPLPWASILIAVFLSAELQLSGINAVMNFAPEILKASDLTPMQANALVMAWNFVTTFGSIPLSKRISSVPLYLMSGTGLSLVCVVFGVGVMPGVLTNEARKIVSLVGCAAYLAFFEFGIGPVFYVVSTETFVPSERSRAAAVTQTAQFIFIIMINFGFPVCVEAISGGADGNQFKGLAVMFLIFAACGFISVCALVLLYRARGGTAGSKKF